MWRDGESRGLATNGDDQTEGAGASLAENAGATHEIAAEAQPVSGSAFSLEKGDLPSVSNN